MVKDFFKKTIFLIMVLFFLSSCNSGIFKSSEKKEITNGDGLLVDFSTDSKWIPDISYDLSLTGNGKNPILVKKENLKFETSFIKKDGGSIFTSESIEKFYNTIFENGDEVELIYDKKINLKGTLEIDPNEYKENLDLKTFEYTLKINYDYKTEFNYNIELNLKEKTLNEERKSQAAPIKITNIDMYPRGNDDYKVLYYIEDKGPSSGNSDVKIETFSFKFGETDISSTCKVYIDKDGERREIENSNFKLSKNQKTLIFSCDLPHENFSEEKTTTKTSGEFTYNYEIVKKGSITLPDKRTKGFE